MTLQNTSYINENPYLIGRLLALADRLHLRCCKVVRDGKVPPEVLGKALVPVALDNPTAALATEVTCLETQWLATHYVYSK